MIIQWSEWIDRYVHEVVRHLPRDRRAEVADDLRARLTGEVEARLDATDRSADKIALERLSALGDPAEVAYRLAPDQAVLVGPRILPFFWKCAAGVLLVHLAFTALWLRGFHTVTYLMPFRFAFTGSTSWMDVVFGAIANFGVVVLVFAAVQRWGMGSPSPFPSRWDPRELPPLPAPRQASRGGLAVRLGLALYVLFGLHFAPALFPYLVYSDGTLWLTSLMHPNYRAFLPWIDLWLLPTVLLLLWEMERGETRAAERWAMAGLDALGAIVLFGIALGGPFTVLDAVFDPLIFVLGIAFAVSAVLLAAGTDAAEAADLAGEEGSP
ncbi:MAG TPA: hypothetical protein VEY33_05410 [Gemmatimonadota bacterium]|nr:hypothetical protein [Gemmatimonadota bacterium]